MTTLPLSIVEISGFCYFIFSIILFQKTIHLLLLYPKHVRKLLGYISGCNKKNEVQVNDNFPDEKLIVVSDSSMVPWFVDYVNYLVAKVTPAEFTYQQKKKFFTNLKHYYWEESFLYKHYADKIIRRCVKEEEMEIILIHCHSLECGGTFKRK